MLRLALIVPALLLAAGLLALLVYVAALSRHRKSSQGALTLVGRLACVEEPLNPEGAVLVEGELWRARTATGESIGRGRSNVRITGASGHLLEVERVA